MSGCGSLAGNVHQGAKIGKAVTPPGCNITAYIPDGDYCNENQNLEVVPIIGSTPRKTMPIALLTACAANQNTETVVCTDNFDGIYQININGDVVTSTTSAAVNQEVFSECRCTTCGLVVDSKHNRAIVSIANDMTPTPVATAALPGAGAFQILDLASNKLSAPISGVGSHQIAESFGLDNTSNLILSANESGFFDLIDITNPALPLAYSLTGAPLMPETTLRAPATGAQVTTSSEFDTAATDLTGIAIAGGETSGNLFIADLSRATFSPGANPPTWSAPNQIQNLPEFEPGFGYFSRGLTAIAIALGSNDAFLEDEFGIAGTGAGIGAIKLPTSGGTGTPAVSDWVVAHMPTTPDNASWNMPGEPHGLTAVNANLMITDNGVMMSNAPRPFGFVINRERTYLGLVDLEALLTTARRAASNTHQLDPNFQPLQQNLIAYIAVKQSSTVNQVQNGDFNDGFGFYTVSPGSAPVFPQNSINTDAGSCLPQQFGNPFASLNVPNSAHAFFEQQVSVPDPTGLGAPAPVLKFTSWGSVSPVIVTVTVTPSGGASTVLDAFTAPQIMTNDTTCSGIGPATKTYSLMAFEGQLGVTIHIEATSTGSDQAIANFDNIFVGAGP